VSHWPKCSPPGPAHLQSVMFIQCCTLFCFGKNFSNNLRFRLIRLTSGKLSLLASSIGCRLLVQPKNSNPVPGLFMRMSIQTYAYLNRQWRSRHAETKPEFTCCAYDRIRIHVLRVIFNSGRAIRCELIRCHCVVISRLSPNGLEKTVTTTVGTSE